MRTVEKKLREREREERNSRCYLTDERLLASFCWMKSGYISIQKNIKK